ncbi:unnamed protein product, partial [Mesorhabditis spiculigera]
MKTVIDTLVKLVTSSLLNCTDVAVPPSEHFLSNLTPPYIITLSICSVVCMGTIAMGALQVMYTMFYVGHRDRRLFIAYLASTAPFVSGLSLCAMYMPRVWFLSHLISFLYFSVALWIIICLLMQIFEGHNSLVNKMHERDIAIDISTPPFCCVFPCLPKVQLEERKIRACEWLVLQCPCVRLVATLISLFIYFEYGNDGMIPLKVLDFVAVPSVLLGIFGMHVLVTTVSNLDELISYRYIVVFRLLDLFFMFFGLQQPVFDFLARYGAWGCGVVLPPLETAFWWKNAFTVIEAFCVTLLASVLIQPKSSALFDKHPSMRSMGSSLHTVEETIDDNKETVA